MKIITVTLNPAYDIYYRIQGFRPYHENFSDPPKRFTGGKGYNVSRSLMENGCMNEAYLLLGRDNREQFIKECQASAFPCRIFDEEGSVRENITILSEGNSETRININHFSSTPEKLEEMAQAIKKDADNQTVVIFAGKMPLGITHLDAVRFLSAIRVTTPYLVVDSSFFSLSDLQTIRPFFVKPNEEEIESLFGIAIQSDDARMEAIMRLHRLGIPHVLHSLGKDGAIYAGEEGCYRITIPSIPVLSAVGAGDAATAGFFAAFQSGAPITECLVRSCAFGSAACLREGTAPPAPADVAVLLKQIQIERIS